MAQGLLSPDDAREALDDNPKHSQTFVLRLLGPVITFVDRPWKVGIPSLSIVFVTHCLDRCIPSGCCLV